MKSKCICIIPARSGSKRIKNKNFIKILNRPIISYVIKVALKSLIFDKVYVTTDSKKIKNIATKYGAEVPFLRSKKLSNNKTAIYPVIKDFLNKIKHLKDKDIVCVLFPTSIFVTKKLIEKAKKKLTSNNIYVSVIQKFNHPIERGFKEIKNSLKPINRKKIRLRTQDLTPTYYDSGQLYFSKKIFYFSKKKFINKFVKIGYLDAMDIDDYESLNVAKKLFGMKNKN